MHLSRVSPFLFPASPDLAADPIAKSEYNGAFYSFIITTLFHSYFLALYTFLLPLTQLFPRFFYLFLSVLFSPSSILSNLSSVIRAFISRACNALRASAHKETFGSVPLIYTRALSTRCICPTCTRCFTQTRRAPSGMSHKAHVKKSTCPLFLAVRHSTSKACQNRQGTLAIVSLPSSYSVVIYCIALHYTVLYFIIFFVS